MTKLFEGHCSPCASQAVHAPHETGTYHTVRYGALSYFCPGAGSLRGQVTKGAPEFPATVREGAWAKWEREIAARAAVANARKAARKAERQVKLAAVL